MDGCDVSIGGVAMNFPVRRWRWLLPWALFAGLVVFYALGLDEWLQLSTLRAQQHAWQQFHAQHPILTIASYLLVYVLLVAFSLPGGAWMTLVGGFLFGAWLGGLLAALAATTGATLVFLLARSAWGESFRARVQGRLRQMQQGFARDAMSYMLMLRLVPLFPFFLVNLAPAFLGVPLRVYLLATFLGILPATFAFAFAGSSLRSVVDSDQAWSLARVMNAEMIVALSLLGLLALVPALYRYRLAKSRDGDG